MGSILLIEEDKYGTYSRVLSKYFLAEGVQRKHGIFLATCEEDPNLLLRNAPRPAMGGHQETNEQEPIAVDNDDMRIAFRYNQLPKVNSEIAGSSSTRTCGFDLSTTIQEEHLNGLDITCLGGDVSHGQLIKILKEMTSRPIYAKSVQGECNLLRVCINSFGSPLWLTSDPNNFAKALLSTLLHIRAVVRNSNSVVVGGNKQTGSYACR